MASLSAREEDALRALDWVCWEDSDAGGGGWATIREVAAWLEVGYSWASLLLGALRHQGMVESRGTGAGMANQPKRFAPTERGAQFLFERDSDV